MIIFTGTICVATASMDADMFVFSRIYHVLCCHHHYDHLHVVLLFGTTLIIIISVSFDVVILVVLRVYLSLAAPIKKH